MEQNFNLNDLLRTFESLSKLAKDVNELKSLLLQKQAEQTTTEQSEIWFDLNELIEYDPEKRTKPTWYSKISRNEVPYYKRGKKIYFLKSEIDEWLRQGKRKSSAQIEAEADVFLSNKRKGLK